jgi:spore germination cell wall hydrolase CwlJ-like protein
VRFHLASLDADATHADDLPAARAPQNGFRRQAIAFPAVDRARKGDFLSTPYAPESLTRAGDPAAAANDPAPPGAAAADAPDDEIEAAIRFEPFPEHDISMSLELYPQIRPEESFEGAVAANEEQPDISVLAMANDPDPHERTARLFFGGDLIGSSFAGVIPWADGERPIVLLPRAPLDPELKQAALTPSDDDPGGRAGESIAGKGEVTSEGRRPMSPAERLNLAGKSREKAEKCLANAVYFESRGESVRGQIAVAQVVMNRVFSGYYPGDVCGVVYQNAHRRLACQFTFACDRIPDVVTEPEPWARAKRIAQATLDGKVWLPDVGKATHYHAYWVRPRWVREMRKLQKIGVHTFYRPRYWGDGSDEPSWGNAAATKEATARM